MKKIVQLVYLLFITALDFSCVENKSTEPGKSELVSASQTDTLKFTSGIRSIFQDSKGNYWFGSLQEGVAMYNGNSFTYLTINDGLTDNQINSIQEDKKGTIWFNTQDGVSSYDGMSIIKHTVTNNASLPSVFPTMNYESSQDKWMKLENDLWFEAGTKEGVYRYDGNRFQYLDFPPHKKLNTSENLFAVTDITQGKNNMIWFGTYAGIFGYNGRDFTIINDETLGFDRNIAPIHIRCILEDSKGRLWIGNNGIGVLLKESDSIINFSSKQNLVHPKSKRKAEKSPQGTLEHVFTIAEDKNGNIWFGDRDAGIWKYDGTIMENFTLNDGLTNDFALSIYNDKNGNLWFGMSDGTIYTFNGTTFDKRF